MTRPTIVRTASSLAVVLGVFLIVAVIGSIYAGVATPTEAAAVGVLGSFAISVATGTFSWKNFADSVMGATRTSCMICFILAGAAFLTLAMGFTGIPRALAEWIGAMQLSRWQLLLALTLFYILLGCFLDGISMVVLTTAVIMPLIEKAGFDLIWFGVYIVIVVEMAQITPPVGFNLFVLQGMTGRQITYIARTAVPMFLLMCVAVLLIYVFPKIVTFLPEQMIGK